MVLNHYLPAFACKCPACGERQYYQPKNGRSKKSRMRKKCNRCKRRFDIIPGNTARQISNIIPKMGSGEPTNPSGLGEDASSQAINAPSEKPADLTVSVDSSDKRKKGSETSQTTSHEAKGHQSELPHKHPLPPTPKAQRPMESFQSDGTLDGFLGSGQGVNGEIPKHPQRPQRPLSNSSSESASGSGSVGNNPTDVFQNNPQRPWESPLFEKSIGCPYSPTDPLALQVQDEVGRWTDWERAIYHNFQPISFGVPEWIGNAFRYLPEADFALEPPRIGDSAQQHTADLKDFFLALSKNNTLTIIPRNPAWLQTFRRFSEELFAKNPAKAEKIADDLAVRISRASVLDEHEIAYPRLNDPRDLDPEEFTIHVHMKDKKFLVRRRKSHGDELETIAPWESSVAFAAKYLMPVFEHSIQLQALDGITHLAEEVDHLREEVSTVTSKGGVVQQLEPRLVNMQRSMYSLEDTQHKIAELMQNQVQLLDRMDNRLEQNNRFLEVHDDSVRNRFLDMEEQLQNREVAKTGKGLRIRKRILEQLGQDDGIHQKELARSVELSYTGSYYHVNALIEAGLIRRERGKLFLTSLEGETIG